MSRTRTGARSRVALLALVCLFPLTTGCRDEDSAPRSVTLTVLNGSGGGDYEPGSRVHVRAPDAPPGMRFAGWAPSDGGFADPDAPSTTFEVPPGPARIAALFLPRRLAAPATKVRAWSKLEIVLPGPASRGMDPESNPFRLRVDVVFDGPESRLVVPAFFAGDGKGGLDGALWKVRFAPGAVGTWQWSVLSEDTILDGRSGAFEVLPPATSGSPFHVHGRVSASESGYLRHHDGTYLLKGGMNEPEDFLANPHLGTSEARRAGVDRLAEAGLNGIYIVTMNVEGDARNVWPWVGESEAEARGNHDRYDVARLEEWERLFAHIQERGLLIQLVLEDDSAWTGFDRALYYREMVARFAHHNGLVWSLAEEFNENYSMATAQRHARLLRSLDPYDHPIALHQAGSPELLAPLLTSRAFDVASIQTAAEPQYHLAREWKRRLRASGRALALCFDETGAVGPGDRDKARRIAWSVFCGGANFEVYIAPVYRGEFTYADYDPLIADLGRARRFVENEVPFWRMTPAPELVVGGAEAHVLSEAGAVTVLYLPTGGDVELDLTASEGRFTVTWFDPEDGERHPGRPLRAGGRVRLGLPPFPGDAVALLRRAGP